MMLEGLVILHGEGEQKIVKNVDSSVFYMGVVVFVRIFLFNSRQRFPI